MAGFGLAPFGISRRIAEGGEPIEDPPVLPPPSELAAGTGLGNDLGDYEIVYADGEIDMAVIDDDVSADQGLRTALILSLFTDRRAEDDDVLPGGDDRRGWWADEFLEHLGDRHGSRLWLLDRSKSTEDVIPRAEDYAREALAWLLEDRVAERVDVACEISGETRTLVITVYRPGLDPTTYRFAHVWDGEAARK